MSDDQTPSSGNRWESTDATADDIHQPAAVTGSRFSRARAGIAAGAVAVLVAVGLGGFAVGRATGDDGGSGPGIQQVGFQPDGDGNGRGPGFGDRDGDHPDVDGTGPDGSDT